MIHKPSQSLQIIVNYLVQEDWFGTKDKIGSSNVHLDSSNLHLDLVPQELILVTAPKLQEDWIGTLTGYQHKFMSINSIRRYSSTWCRREKSWSRHQKLQEVSLYQFILI